MRPDRIVMVTLRRESLVNWRATMEAQLEGSEPSACEGEQIVESFGPPRPNPGRFDEGDLHPGYRVQHLGNVRHVLKFLDLGRPGVFRVGPDGRFDDQHGGHGFVPGDCIRWFTEAALRRGIEWHFIQTYRHAGSNKVVGRFKVHRNISLSGAIEVRKVPLRL